MKTYLSKGLDKDEAKEIREMFNRSRILRKRLTFLLESKIEEHFKAQMKRSNYEEANWAFAQADAMGYCRALREVMGMLADKDPAPVVKIGRPPKDSKQPTPLG